jgi:two-component system OmpR family response regulator
MGLRQNVLIVEDDQELRHLYRATLMLAGYDVREARGGFEALRQLDSHSPDAVVLDLLLPGIDGFTVRQELAAHARTRTIPIVVVTGVLENLDRLDVACVLTKPVSPERLLIAVRGCLSTAAARPV